MTNAAGGPKDSATGLHTADHDSEKQCTREAGFPTCGIRRSRLQVSAGFAPAFPCLARDSLVRRRAVGDRSLLAVTARAPGRGCDMAHNCPELHSRLDTHRAAVHTACATPMRTVAGEVRSKSGADPQRWAATNAASPNTRTVRYSPISRRGPRDGDRDRPRTSATYRYAVSHTGKALTRPCLSAL